jgi:AcrR family transcriptional regulator
MATATSRTRVLSTAEERRESVLEAAMPIVAARGLYGTPTTEIAKAAGISQAYLFRLFPTKLELFVALVDRCYARCQEAFAQAAAKARAACEPPLEAMGAAYIELLGNRDLLLLQLHAHAASDDPQVRDTVRAAFRRLYAFVERESQAPADDIRTFFAQGMLLNVMAAIGAESVGEPWADVLRCAVDE